MNDEIHDLRAAVEALRLECAELRAMAERQQQTGLDSDLLEAVMFRAPTPDEAPRAPSDVPPVKPFDIQYDWAAKEWKIYLPEGCVVAYGKAATYRGGTDGNDMAVITPAETLWAHVGPAGSTYDFAIDGEAPQEEGDDGHFHFKVAGFDSEGTQVMVQYASGVVTVGERDYVCGYNSNITFQTCDDPDDNDRYGKTMIDVYYL